jgi:acid stress chaperone HdeB
MRFLLGTLTATLIAAVTPASAQKLDLSTITCKQFLESSTENRALMLVWLQGYWTDEDDPPILDFDKMTRDADKLGTYCRANPNSGLITAATAVME